MSECTWNNQKGNALSGLSTTLWGGHAFCMTFLQGQDPLRLPSCIYTTIHNSAFSLERGTQSCWDKAWNILGRKMEILEAVAQVPLVVYD